MSADAAERWLTADRDVTAARVPHRVSADAAERWAEAERRRIEAACTSAPSSADAIEHCFANATAED